VNHVGGVSPEDLEDVRKDILEENSYAVANLRKELELRNDYQKRNIESIQKDLIQLKAESRILKDSLDESEIRELQQQVA
jgi:hypothetical protein